MGYLSIGETLLVHTRNISIMAASKNPLSNSLLSYLFLFFVTSSLFLFIGKNLLITGWSSANSAISPLRWVAATVVPVIVVSWGHQKRSLSTSGSLLALVVGFVLSLAHYSYFLSLLAFFVSSSKATKYMQGVKKTFESDFKEGGQRNWLQVFCNGAMATELGSVIAKSDPFLITTFEKVPKGTNGGVTWVGLVSSLIGGLVIGLAYYTGIYMAASQVDKALAPCQLLVILVGGLGGLMGSLLDSLIGATLQFSGKDVKTGKIVEVARDGVVPICGKMVLDNHSVNLVSSILTALILPKIALAMGL